MVCVMMVVLVTTYYILHTLLAPLFRTQADRMDGMYVVSPSVLADDRQMTRST